MPAKKQSWQPGDIFSIQLLDGSTTLGQVLDLMMPNVPSCAFYDHCLPVGALIPDDIRLMENELIAAVATTRDQLDKRAWKVLVHACPALDRRQWPNEHLRKSGWAGAEIFGAGIITRFLEAYYGLGPWNYYKDPAYFDRLLISPEKKPKALQFK